MTAAKPVIPSRQALLDIDEAATYYLAEAGVALALRFADALESGLNVIGRQPGIGSPHIAHEVRVQGLRSWPLTGFPQLLLYIEHEDAVDVVRVLHGSRDLASWLAGPEAD